MASLTEMLKSADKSYQNFMNKKIAPTAKKVGGAIVGTVENLSKIGGNAISTVAWVKDSETAAAENKQALANIDTLLLKNPTTTLNQKVIKPLWELVKDWKPSVIGSTIQWIGDFIQWAWTNIGLSKVADTLEQWTQKIVDTTVDWYEWNKLLWFSSGLATIGLGGLQATPLANLISWVVQTSNDANWLTKQLDKSRSALIDAWVQSWLSPTDANNAVDLAINGAQLLFGMKATKEASKIWKTWAAEAKVSQVMKPISARSIAAESLKSTKWMPLTQRLSGLKSDLKSASILRDVVKSKPIYNTLVESAKTGLSKWDIAKNVFTRTALTAWYASTPDVLQNIAWDIVSGDIQPEETKQTSLGDILWRTATATLASLPIGMKVTGKTKKTPSLDTEVPMSKIDAPVEPQMSVVEKPKASRKAKTLKTTIEEVKQPNLEEARQQSLLEPEVKQPTATIEQPAPDQVKPLWEAPTKETIDAIKETVKAKSSKKGKKAKTLADTVVEDTGMDQFMRQSDDSKDAIGTVKWYFSAWDMLNKVQAYIDRWTSARTLLNNFTIGKAKQLLWNYSTQKHTQDVSWTAKNIYSEWQILEPIKNISDWPKQSLKASDLVGKTSPNGAVYDMDMAKQQLETYKKSIDNVIENRAQSVIARWIPKDELKKAMEVDFIYDMFKWNNEVLKSYLTDGQIEQLNKWYSSGKYDDTMKTTNTTLVDNWVLPWFIDPEKPYKHYVTTYEAASRAGKTIKWDSGGKVEVTIDGKTYMVDSMEDAIRLQNLDPEKLKTNPEAFAAILKRKAGAEYDPYRVHWLINSIIAYWDQAGRLLADKNTVKLIDKVRNEWDKSYTAPIDNAAFSNIVNDIIGINTSSKWWFGKTVDTVGRLTRWTAMLGNVKNIVQGTIYSTNKYGWRTLGNMLINAAKVSKWQGEWTSRSQLAKDIFFWKDKDIIKASLHELGAENPALTDPYGGVVSKIEKEAMDLFYNNKVEVPMARLQALSAMRDELMRNGKLSEKGDGALTIIKAWNDWKDSASKAVDRPDDVKLQADREAYLNANESLNSAIQDIWVTSQLDRMGTPIAWFSPSLNRMFGSLKSWTLGRIWNDKSNLQKIARTVTDKITKQAESYTDTQARDAVLWLASSLATYYAILSATKEALDLAGITWDDDDKDAVSKIARNITLEATPDPMVPRLVTLYEAYKNGSVSQSQLANTVKAMWYAWKSAIEETSGWSEEYKSRMLQNLFKLPLLRNISDAVGILDDWKSLHQTFADDLWTFSKEEATSGWSPTGMNFDSPIERFAKLTWFNIDRARENALYSIKDNTFQPDWVANIPYGNMIFPYMKRELRGITNAIEWTNTLGFDNTESTIASQYTYDAARNLLDSKSLTEFLDKSNVGEIRPLLPQVLKSLVESNIKANTKVSPLLTTLAAGWELSDDQFVPTMLKVKESDPYLFNNFMAKIWEFSQKKDNLDGKQLWPDSVNPIMEKTLKSPTESTTYDNYAISQAFNDQSITTAFTQSFWKDIDSVKTLLSKGKPEDAKKKLEQMDAATQIINTPTFSWYKNAFGNLYADKASSFKEITDTLKENFVTQYPNIASLMLFGAKVVRGWREPVKAQAPTPTPVQWSVESDVWAITTKPSSLASLVVDKPNTVDKIVIDKPTKIWKSLAELVKVEKPQLSKPTLQSLVSQRRIKL